MPINRVLMDYKRAILEMTCSLIGIQNEYWCNQHSSFTHAVVLRGDKYASPMFRSVG